ncbi:DUF6090 family protein [Subsaxibacter sp. CAU 1640]|uniref:DUF6090 family protein n=1 Tax=Subsaxibacter sp. CAU 1640 TaxID=2933271 RepID=UPI0020045D1D|nr:DUF6090 family protein [Subsaxibacter sp. CAU 1640]MCK7590513.1 DUF6090 family protein [Subsaxibacter sp. CAU 1640]
MIKFFKNLRQRTLRENRFSKYLLYAIGEIILVVIGILIALGINNWNEKRKEQQIVHNYYEQLLQDMNADMIYTKNRIEIISKHRNEFKTYEEGFKQSNLQPSDLGSLLEQYTYEQLDIEYQSSTIETLISTGEIKLFNPRLRELLSMYSKEKAQTIALNRQNNNDVSDLLKEVMLRGGVLTVLQSNRLQNQPYLVEIIDMGKRFSDFYLALESYFLWRDHIEETMIEGLNNNIKLAETVVEHIENELNK